MQIPNGALPLLAPMSEVAGRLAPQVGAATLMKAEGGRGVLMGGVPGVYAAKVVVIGASVSGLNAAAIAAGMQPDALGELTPQQRQIVRLASDGLTDREIGDRLFLSPRTVSSHLHRSYPKLGVASRHQLRDVIAAPAHESAGSRTLR